MTLDRDASPQPGGQHRCASEAELLGELERLLVETRSPAEFSERLQGIAALGGCRKCHVRLMDLASERADRERDDSNRRFENYAPSTISRLILESRPRAWPPHRRWPELEALASSTVRQRPGAPGKLTNTLRDLVLTASRDSEARLTVDEALRYLQRHLVDHSSEDQLSRAGCAALDRSLLEQAFRRAGDEEDLDSSADPGDDRHAAWAHAVECLQDLESMPSEHAQWPLSRGSEPPQSGTLPALSRRRQRRVNPKIAFRFAKSIEDSVWKLAQLEGTATQLCSEVVERGFRFAGVSLIRLDQRIIEAIAGCGDAAEWAGRVRHPIHPDLPLSAQDIQCHVVLSETAEMVPPSDSRLDPFVREHFHHEHKRYFIPLMIAYDGHGRHIPHSAEYRWEQVPGEPWKLHVVRPAAVTARVFGTLEVGIEGEPNLDEFIDLANFSLLRAFSIYSCTTARVFDTIVTLIRRLSGSKTATLHHGRWEPPRIRWAAHFCFGSEHGKAPCLMSPANKEGAIGGNPRPGGLGEECIRAKKPRIRSGAALATSNPLIYKENIRSMVALPLFAGPEVGVLFLHREQEEPLSDAEMLWINLLVQRAGSAIQQARAYTEERRRRFQLMGQLKTTRALFQTIDESPDRLGAFVTGSILNLSTADLALLYRVYPDHCKSDSSAGIRMAEPRLDGDLIDLVETVTRSGAPRLFRSSDWLQPSTADSPMCEALRRARRFAEAERINFIGIIPVRYGGGRPTVLVFAYRRTTEPATSERRNLELLASMVPVALEVRDSAAPKRARVAASTVCLTLDAISPRPLNIPSSPRSRPGPPAWR